MRTYIKGNRKTRWSNFRSIIPSLALIGSIFIIAFIFFRGKSTTTATTKKSEIIEEDHTHGLHLAFDINHHMTKDQQKYKKIADQTLANTQLWINKYSHLNTNLVKHILTTKNSSQANHFSCKHYSGCAKVKYIPLPNKYINKPVYKYQYHWKNPPRTDLPSTALTSNQWLKIHQTQISNMVHMKDCQNIFIGDSITYKWLYSQQPQNKYISELFYNVFGRQSIVFAIGGDRIQEIGWRLLNGKAYDIIDKCFAHNIILNVGTNDIGSDERIDVILKEYSILLMQLKIFIDSLNDNNIRRNINVYVVGVFPRIDYRLEVFGRDEVGGNVGGVGGEEYSFMKWNGDNLYFEIVSVVNEFLKDWTMMEENKNRFTFVDCGEYFYEKIEGKEKIVSSEVMYDFLHLTYEGYQRYAECLNQFHFKRVKK